MKYIIKLIFILFLHSSCIKEVDYELPFHKPKLVVTSLFTSEETMKVTITKTQSAKDTMYTIDENVGIWIETNGLTHILNRISRNTFQSTFYPVENQEYTIKVQAPGFETVTAQDYIPGAVGFEIDNYNPVAYIDNEGFNFSAFQITLLDIPKTRTYFELRMIKKHLVGEVTDYSFSGLESYDLVFRNEGLVNQLFDKIGLLFTNELISTDNRSIWFNFENRLEDDYVKLLSVEIQLRTITKAYYEFKKKLYLNIENQTGDVWDGSGNPVEAFSNIKNGYGIFAGFSQSSQIYIFP